MLEAIAIIILALLIHRLGGVKKTYDILIDKADQKLKQWVKDVNENIRREFK